VLQTAARHTDRLSRWVQSIHARCGYHKAIVAVAAKNARILWAVMARKERFTPQPA
jgi:hypothetical protein